MKRSGVFVALAGLAATLASVVVYAAIKRRDAEVQQAIARTVNLVVAACDLPLGARIDAEQVKLVKWAAEAVPQGTFTKPSQVVGAFVRSRLVANEPIVANKLFLGQKSAGVMPFLIPPGMRAVAVPVDEVSDIAGFVLPHTRVDVLVALSGQGGTDGKPFSKIVLQNVEVLAVAQKVEQKKDQPELVRVVTLLVTPQEAERLALASRQGTLRLAMRNFADDRIVITGGTDIAQMLHAYAPAPLPPITTQARAVEQAAPAHPVETLQVEIFRNGKSSESVSFVNEALAEPPSHRAAARSRSLTKVADGASPGQPASRPPSAVVRTAESRAYVSAQKVLDAP